MSPVVNADFTKISTDFEPLPVGDYNFVIDEIESGKTQDGKKDQLIFKHKVVGGELDGRVFQDFVVLQKNDGNVNNISLGRIKAYAEAILGKESANAPTGIDTDTLLKGSFHGIIKEETYEKKEADGSSTTKKSTKLSKILPAQ